MNVSWARSSASARLRVKRSAAGYSWSRKRSASRSNRADRCPCVSAAESASRRRRTGMVPPERSAPRIRPAPFMLALAGGLSLMASRDGGRGQPGPEPVGGDGRSGRAPWPGRHRGLAGRAEEPHARGARAEPSASGYGFVSLSSPWPVVMSGPGGRERPAVFGWTVPEDSMSRGRHGASPEGGHAGGIFRSAAPGTTVPLGRPAGTAVPPGVGCYRGLPRNRAAASARG